MVKVPKSPIVYWTNLMNILSLLLQKLSVINKNMHRRETLENIEGNNTYVKRTVVSHWVRFIHNGKGDILDVKELW